MDSRSIVVLRLRNLRLIGAPFATPTEAIRTLGAVQSQDHGPAKWSVAMRTRAVSDAAMDREFADGRFLRTHVLRPTWHFVTPEDIVWMLELTAPRVHARNAPRYRELGLDKSVRDRSARSIVKALRDDIHLTRKQLKERLESA
ncbi:MAG TPA: crosslink repair DNA glycosylase YcaQ family protein, partial [Actinomycetota bacterium]|nr:crosslink repair DNA glycosylase YcaQ family protein [Actinomycetota bacterium]